MGAVALLAGNPDAAYAACAGENTGNVLCDAANQATAGTLVTNFAGTTVVNVNPGGKIDTGGASASTSFPTGDITFNHNDTIFGITNKSGSGVQVTAFGAVMYNGKASVAAQASGISIQQYITAGDGTVINNASVNAVDTGISVSHLGSGRIQITNNGDVIAGTGIFAMIGLGGPPAGTNGISVSGSGNVTGSFRGIDTLQLGASKSDILIDYSGKVSGGAGIVASTLGTGNVTVITANDVTGTMGAAISAQQSNNDAGTHGNIHVGGSGDLKSTSAIGIAAQISGQNNSGDILVNHSGTIASEAEGVFAQTAGAGNVTVSGIGNVKSANAAGIFASALGNGNVLVAPTGTVAGKNGISAQTSGIGTVEVITANTVTATSASGTGIAAQQKNNDLGSNSGIHVGGTGTINSAGAGISAHVSGLNNKGNVLVDYTGNVTSAARGGVALAYGGGNVTVTGTGNVASASVIGIEAASSGGNGNVVVTPAGRVSSEVGIAARVDGTGTITVNTANDVTGALTGIFTLGGSGLTTVNVAAGTVQGALQGIQTWDGAVDVRISAGAAVKGGSVAGIEIGGVTNHAITNSGAISGIIGIRVYDGTTTIINAGSIVGTGGTAVQLGGANNLFVMQGPAAALTGRANGSFSDTFRLAGTGTNTLDVGQIGFGWTLLEKNDSSTWTLTGTSFQYWGPTVVNGGTLLVNGPLASSDSMTVNAGGTLGGTGVVPRTTINGGTLSPGNSIGTLTINGSLTFAGPGIYFVEVSPTAADRTNVNGPARLQGTVNASFQPGSYVQRSYTILSATGGLSGQFNSLVTANLPSGIVASLSYNNTDVFLDLIASLPLTGLNRNQNNVGDAINAGFNLGGAPAEFLALFGLTGTNLGNALTRLSGEIATGASTAGTQAAGQFLNLMLDPFLENRAGGASIGVGGPALSFAPDEEGLAELAFAKGMPRKAPPPVPSFERRWSVWGAGYGGHGSFDGDAVVGSNNLSTNTAGVAGGVDYRFGNALIGGAVTGQSLSYNLDAGLGAGKGDAVQGGLYGSTRWDNAYVSAAVSFGWFDIDTTRVAAVAPGISNVLTGDVSATSFAGRIEGGYRVPVLQSSGITPYAALQAIRFHTDAYTETGAVGGAAFALSFAENTTNDIRSELGVRGDTRMLLSDTAMLILRGRAAWAHSFDTDRSINPFFVNLPGAGFTVFGATPAENAAVVSAGGEIRFANGFSALAKFDGEFSGDTTVYAGSGTLRYSW